MDMVIKCGNDGAIDCADVDKKFEKSDSDAKRRAIAHTAAAAGAVTFGLGYWVNLALAAGELIGVMGIGPPDEEDPAEAAFVRRYLDGYNRISPGYVTKHGDKLRQDARGLYRTRVNPPT